MSENPRAAYKMLIFARMGAVDYGRCDYGGFYCGCDYGKCEYGGCVRVRVWFRLNEVFIYPLFSTCTWNYYTLYNPLLGNVRTT